jgi:hypothetical protein
VTARTVRRGGVRRYVAVLETRHMAPLLAAAFAGRLPVGMFSLATVLFLSGQTGSFAVAGAATGAFAIASGTMPYARRATLQG